MIFAMVTTWIFSGICWAFWWGELGLQSAFSRCASKFGLRWFREMYEPLVVIISCVLYVYLGFLLGFNWQFSIWLVTAVVYVHCYPLLVMSATPISWTWKWWYEECGTIPETLGVTLKFYSWGWKGGVVGGPMPLFLDP